MKRLLKKSKLSLEDILNKLNHGEKIGFYEQGRTINFQELRNILNEEEMNIKNTNEEEKKEKQKLIKEIRKHLVQQYKQVKETIQLFNDINNPIKEKIKTVTIFSGPSGSGKSTITQILKDQVGKIVDVDELGRLEGLGFDESRERGRELINTYIDKGISFSIENTLRTDNAFEIIKKAKANGYQIVVYYIGLMDVELNVERVRERVEHGGNLVPEDAIISIYEKSLTKMKDLVEQADVAAIIDNSGIQPLLVAKFKNGKLTYKNTEYVEWVEEALK